MLVQNGVKRLLVLGRGPSVALACRRAKIADVDVTLAVWAKDVRFAEKWDQHEDGAKLRHIEAFVQPQPQPRRRDRSRSPPYQQR
jgi:hypothetical protein